MHLYLQAVDEESASMRSSVLSMGPGRRSCCKCGLQATEPMSSCGSRYDDDWTHRDDAKLLADGLGHNTLGSG